MYIHSQFVSSFSDFVILHRFNNSGGHFHEEIEGGEDEPEIDIELAPLSLQGDSVVSISSPTPGQIAVG